MKINQLEHPKKTYFFEREDGTTFATQEGEAWTLVSRGNQVVGYAQKKPKLVGVSDGTKMYIATQEAHRLVQTDPEAAKERLRNGYKEELEAARGHVEMPRNMDSVGRGGQPVSINELR